MNENNSQPANKSSAGRWVKKYISDGLRYTIPLCVSAGLIIWLFNKVDFKEVVSTIKEGCDFFWIAVMMVITAVSHMARGVRWGMQLRAAGVRREPVVMEWSTIWGAYALNLVFPQLGEGWRCVYVARREKASLSTVIGTDIGDRAADFVVIMALTLTAFICAHPEIEAFLNKYPLGTRLEHYVSLPWLWTGAAVAIGAVWYVLHFKKQYKWVRKTDNSIESAWKGISIIFHMKKWWLYVLLTLATWACYFLELYVCLFAFPFTRTLTEARWDYGLLPGLVAFVFGAFSMAIPSNGGLGPWNLAVMFAFTLFGLTATQGTAFSIVMWSCQAVMLIALGIFAAIYLSVTDRKTK